MIISFGYKGGNIPTAQKVFDVRDLTHKTSDPVFQSRKQEILDYCKTNPGDTVAIGCEKGSHRSVVLAREIARDLRRSVVHK